MCGLAGFYRCDFAQDEPVRIVSSMLRQIAHRGPDDAGLFVDNVTALGSVRLSIVDVRNGSQPMASPDGRHWICYNGELYNHVELRQELSQLGETFQTRSDTEVVLKACVRWGVDALRRFNGAFAFAIYDGVERSLFLARDRFGKRPLFLARHRGGVLFASEMKAFLAVPQFEFAFDADDIGSIFLAWAPAGGQTGYRGIEQVPMGEWRRFDAHGVTGRRWASLDLKSSGWTGTEDEAIDEIGARVRDATAIRLQADAEVGVYLSGGLDSSIVAQLASELVGGGLRTFSIEFADAELDESADQAALSTQIGSRHTAIRVTDDDIVTHLPAAVFHAECPLFRTAPVPMFMLSACVRAQGVKVVLSGEGADEAFLGYGIFKDTSLLSAWGTLDRAERLRRIGRSYPYLEHFNTAAGQARMLLLYENFTEERTEGLFSHQMRLQNSRLAGRLLRGGGDPLGALKRLVDDPLYRRLDPVERAQWLEYNTLLVGYLLSSQGDRMALAHGVENRCPFLDPAVLAVALATNRRFDDGLEEKRLLRRAFASRLPDAILVKGKFPYRAPDALPFVRSDSESRDMLHDAALLDEVGLLEPRIVARFVDRVFGAVPGRLGTTENQAFVLLLSLLWLHRKFVRREGFVASMAGTGLRVIDHRRAIAA